MSDLIDRKAAIDALWKISHEHDSVYYTSAIYTAVDAIEELPSAQPEPKRGEWIPIRKGERGFSAGDFRCSICHQPNKCYTMTNYCSHCGAYMKPTEKNDQ